MRTCHANLLVTCILGVGLGAAAHCPTHIINSSAQPWILASTHIQGDLQIRVLHLEAGGPLAQGILTPAQGGYFIMPAHSIVGLQALDRDAPCEARFRLLDHTWAYPTECVLTYAAPAAAAAADGPDPGGSLSFSVPAAGRKAAASIVREPSPVILQILRDQWGGALPDPLASS